MNTAPKPKEVLREGAAEVREKLKADLSNWGKFRRFISLAPTMACMDCDGTGHETCSGCGGTGKHKLVWNDEIETCPTCQGTGSVTCTECIGKGTVPNKRRKVFLWLFGLGGVAWAYIFFRLWGGDVAPELRSKYIHGGGGGGAARAQFAPRANRGSVAAPGQGAPGAVQPGSVGQPGVGGQPAPGPGLAPPPGQAPPGQVPPGGGLSPRGGQMMPQGGMAPQGGKAPQGQMMPQGGGLR